MQEYRDARIQGCILECICNPRMQRCQKPNPRTQRCRDADAKTNAKLHKVMQGCQNIEVQEAMQEYRDARMQGCKDSSIYPASLGLGIQGYTLECICKPRIQSCENTEMQEATQDCRGGSVQRCRTQPKAAEVLNARLQPPKTTTPQNPLPERCRRCSSTCRGTTCPSLTGGRSPPAP